MPLGEPKFEQIKKKPWQEEIGFRKVKGFVKEQAELLRKEGFPIGPDGRISPDQYLSVYSQEVLSEDNKKVQDYEKKFSQNIYSTRDVENSDAGEGFEILTMAILQKFLSQNKEFCILRSSKFDDIINKVDLLILDRKNGAIVCGLDDVQSEDYDVRTEKKKENARYKNEKYGGASVRYGFNPEKENDGTIKFKLGGMNKVPIIIFPVSGREVESAIENFNTHVDKKLFDKFLRAMNEQINELSTSLSDQSSKERLSHLKESLRDHTKQKELAGVR